MNKVVHHSNQNIFEYYINGRVASLDEINNLRFEYVQLVHSQNKNKNGLYGEYIKW